MNNFEFEKKQKIDSTDTTANKVSASEEKQNAAQNNINDAQDKNTIWQSYYARQAASQASYEEQATTNNDGYTPAQSQTVENTAATTNSTVASSTSPTYGNSYTGAYYNYNSNNQSNASTVARTVTPSAQNNTYITGGGTTQGVTSTTNAGGYNNAGVGNAQSTTAPAATANSYGNANTANNNYRSYGNYGSNNYTTQQQPGTTQNRQSYVNNSYTSGTQYNNTSATAGQAQQNTATGQVYQANGVGTSSQNANNQWGGAQPPTNHNYGSYSSQPPQGNSGSPKKAKKPRKTLAGIALVLVCFVAGFGGSAIGNNITKNNVETKVTSSVVASGISAGESTAANSISDIASKAGQSVVSIITENLQTDPFTGGQVVSGAGSGVIMSADGYIITNNHVVDGAQSVSVTLPDGNQYPATVIGADATTDIAVIKIDVTGLTAATFSDSSELRVGDFCMAIGNPMGVLSGTVTDGIISALDREITIDGNTMNLLQMNAAVSPGNSGGGLFNSNGDLVGIVNAKTSGDNAEGLGFAIPANTALEIATTLIENGYVTGRPSIGISVVEVSDSASTNRYTQSYTTPGVYVSQVTSGGAGEKAGMQAGDQIVSIDGQEISATLDISQILSEKSAGDTISVDVLRNGQTVALTVELQELVP